MSGGSIVLTATSAQGVRLVAVGEEWLASHCLDIWCGKGSAYCRFPKLAVPFAVVVVSMIIRYGCEVLRLIVGRLGEVVLVRGMCDRVGTYSF